MERHAVVLMAYNQTRTQYDLTVEAIESILAQDIGPLDLMLIDNGSTDPDTWPHFQMISDLYLDSFDTRVHRQRHKPNNSPVKVSNRAMGYFYSMGHQKVLGVANDVILPRNAYRLMAQWPRGFVTASETKERGFPIVETAHMVSECTPMAVSLVRKWFWDAMVSRDGYFFDEKYTHYVSDCDLAVRMRLCGLHGVQLDLPYYHYGSASWRMLNQEDGRKITTVADSDREYFEKKWGFKCDSWEYGQMPGDSEWQRIQVSQKAVAASPNMR